MGKPDKYRVRTVAVQARLSSAKGSARWPATTGGQGSCSPFSPKGALLVATEPSQQRLSKLFPEPGIRYVDLPLQCR